MGAWPPLVVAPLERRREVQLNPAQELLARGYD